MEFGGHEESLAPAAFDDLGILRIEIHGSWSVADLTGLLNRMEDAYKVAAALESLTETDSWPTLNRSPQHPGLSADDLIQTATAFHLAGGLRIAAIHYGSPGFLEVIGALNPLKTVKDGITENREINRKRDRARQIDERKRERQVMHHEEATAREIRESERERQQHDLEIAMFKLKVEQARFDMIDGLLDRLPSEQQSVAAAQIIQQLMEKTEAIANDGRVDAAIMLPEANSILPPPQGFEGELD